MVFSYLLGPVVVDRSRCLELGPVVVAYIGRIDRAGSGALERICSAVERTCWIRPGGRIGVMATKGLGGHGHERVWG